MIHKLSDELTSAIESEGLPLFVMGNDEQHRYAIIAADDVTTGDSQRQETDTRRSSYDRDALRAAILNRRDESRLLNQEWTFADQETWEAPSSRSGSEA